MKTIAIIMARGGSKGLPGKNLKPLAGRPLLVYSIESALKSGACDAVLVTTEDDKIAEVARQAGALVPFKRPADLAGDAVPPEPVIQHALLEYEKLSGQKFDVVVYLQPTDIFRTPDTIRECVDRLKKNPELDTVFSAYETHKHYWKKGSTGKWERITSPTYSARQERGRNLVYREDQGVASATRAKLIREGKRVGENVDLVITHDFRTAIDIHTEFDFWLAEKVMTEWPSHAEQPVASASFLGTDLKTWSQSIRNGYIRSFIIFALHETGVLNAMKGGEAQTSLQLAQKAGVNAHLLDGVLNFLAHADEVVKKAGDQFSLTQKGREWLFTDPVLAMSFGAVGAYNCILTSLVATLRNEMKYGQDFIRPGDLIAKGSYHTGKSNYPWVVAQLKELGVKTVADLGCGLADVLVGFCKIDPALKGVGVDISPEALNEAGKRVQTEGLSSRIRLVEGDLTQPSTFEASVRDVDAFNGIMVFHEFLRDGEEFVIEMFRKMKKAFPGKYLLIGEFDRISDDEYQSMPYPDRIHPLFYQYVIHPLTWQGLPQHKETWLRIFERAGLKVVRVKDDFPFRLVEFVLQF